jgi:hypothetical protein
MDTRDIDRLLEEQQTGAYVPSQEEQELADRMQAARASRPQDGAPRPGPGFAAFRLNPAGEMRNENVTSEAAAAGWGQSRFDRAEFHPDDDLENKRANEQTGFNKILNGAMKGVIFAGTTAVETVAGVIDGIVEGTVELGRQVESGDELSLSEAIGNGVNNWTARTMANIQKLSDEWFPNYRTTEERSSEYQSQWLRHILTPNFIGDSFLKNFGFTVGALAGGAVWSKLINAGLKTLSAGNMLKGITAAANGSEETKALLGNTLKLVGEAGSEAAVGVEASAVPKMFERAAKGLNKLTTKHELFGGVIAAMGEGTMEGVMARNEFMDDWGKRLRDEYVQSYTGLRDKLTEELADTEFTRVIPIFDANGTQIDKKYELNDRGEACLAAEQRNLAADYAKKKQWAEEQGDRLAATTFLLNIPVLTVSNTMQFGRMLAGGFKTSRNSLAKVAGKLSMDGERVVADYTAKTGNKALRILGKSAKIGATESAEEMSQGFISSGAKHVADARLTSFNDDGYDKTVLSSVGDWLGGMMEGGGAYLSDWKNWQEGFLGLLTGIVGIPGRHGWNGGIAGAIREVNEENAASQAAAERLNERVNSPAFQKAWKGYVRHQKYDAEMEDAAIRDDQYAWATANNKQLVSDIMMFANAGRLQELNDLVDYYANMSDQQAEEKGVPEVVSGANNETDVQNNPGEAISRVKEQSQNIKDAIALYSEMYDNMRTLAPVSTSDAQLEEMVATAMNIKMMERRFLSMFDEVIAGIGEYVRPLAEADENGVAIENEEKKRQRAESIYTTLTKLITNPGTGINYSSVQDWMDTLFSMRLLDDAVDASENKEIQKKFSDMKKVANDRRAFLRKLVTLQNLDPETFDKKAETPEKAANTVQKQNADKALSDVKTFRDIKSKYLALDDKGRKNYIDTIAPKEKESRPVKDFLDFKRKFDGFREYLEKNDVQIEQPQGAMPVDATMLSTIVDELFERAHGPEELDTLPPTIFRVESEFINDPTFEKPNPIPGMSPFKPTAATFNALKDGIRRAMKDYLAQSVSTASANTGSSKPAETAAPTGITENTPTGYDASQPGSNTSAPGKPAPKTTSSQPAESPSSSTPVQQAGAAAPQSVEADSEQPTMEKTAGQEADDAMSAEEPAVSKDVQEETRQENGKGREKIPYIRTSIPEIASAEARKVRRAIERHDREARMEADLSDFIEYLQNRLEEARQRLEEADKVGDRDEHNEAKRAVEYWQKQYDSYKDTWNALKDRGAFDEIVDGVRLFDEVEFIIDPTFPKYKNEDQILIRNKRTGRIFTVLSMQESDYYGLHDLRQAILKEYSESNGDPNDVFVFSKTSKVWAKQSGYIDYNFDAKPKDIREIPGYENVKDAPLMMVDKAGSASIVRGEKVAIPFTFQSPEQNKDAKRQGGLYILVKTDAETYTPIGLTTERFSADTKAADNIIFNDIRKAATKVANFFRNVGSDMEAENQGLKARVKELAELLDLHDVDFRVIVSEGTPALQITTGKPNEDAVGDTPTIINKDAVTPEVLVDYLADLNRHVQIDQNRLSGMIEAGLIQSNAAKLRPKGMDVYMDPWLGDKFGPLTDSQREAHAQESPEAAEREEFVPVVPEQETVNTENDNFDETIGHSARASRRREQARQGKASGEEPATSLQRVNWADIPKEAKAVFEKDGYTEQLWNTLSAEAQQYKLRCFTVG